ncbi:MAG TPA: prepilin-type N-terminal cleavage/methylation domain-containing protein [Gemmatimonadaceae bacterium]|nr:prepilin-type N-terminal cleavage/methylation domain-containing protein [Gemmatimonadaceae bacterium]
MKRYASRRRRGFTLMELLISMTVMMIAMAAAIPFFVAHSRSLSAQAGRLDAQQSVNFALDQMERELRVAGVGVVARQPLLVAVGGSVLSFNADLTSNVSGDFGAVYYDPDAPNAEVGLLWPSRRISLPNTPSWTYPDSAYWQSPGVPSSAETITYYVEPDPQASGLHRLMRRVNDATPRVVARGIKLVSTQPFFRYFKTNTTGALVEIPQSTLPMRHLNGWHGSPADTGKSALVDSVRLVAIRFTAVYRDPRSPDATRYEERSVRLTNAGLVRASTCGEAPLPVTSVTVTANSTPSVIVSWNRSGDEGAGERDVERYGIYRRLASDPTFGEPLASVAAGLSSYTFTDTDVVPGESYRYGVIALDCTPASSSMTVSAAVVVP